MSHRSHQSPDRLDSILARIDRHLERNIETLFQFLSIPSISTDSDYHTECQAAAEWVDRQLKDIGFESAVRQTQGRPIVLAHWPQRRAVSSEPTVLFYGHYDVQPPDPLDLWQHPPFAPQLETRADGGRHITARGVADNKGQLMTFIEACRAHVEENGNLQSPVSILIEGEEEIGSPSLAPFLASYQAELECDVVLVCDTLMWKPDTPAITTRLRGMLSMEVEVEAASCDLHSGLYGNAARNSIQVLTRVLADLVDTNGRIQVPGFYEGVREVPEAVRQQWQMLGFEEQDFLGGVGLQQPAGESGYSVLEQLWARPSCDICGIVGGYSGRGFKTVIPSVATAKVSFRLVPGQVPEEIRRRFEAFVRDRIPADCEVRFIRHGISNPTLVDESNPHLIVARNALDQAFDKKAVLIGCGASIPVVEMFKRELDVDCLLTGFALEEDRIHSPNEKYEVSSFHRGTRFWAQFLSQLGNHAPAREGEAPGPTLEAT